MDICTVAQFRDSLNSPDKLLKTQHNIIFEPETLCCSKHFAEAQAMLNNREVMLYAPITLQAADMVRTALECIRMAGQEISDMYILEKEILYSGLVSGKSCMIIESVPPGIPLSEALYTHSRVHLIMGLNKLRARLKRYDLSHNYINIYNIYVDSNHDWHTIRNFHVSQGYGNDKRLFEELEQRINECALPETTSPMVKEQLSLYSTVRDNDGTTIHPIKESRRRFQTPNGVGFKDRDGSIVIADEYLWASDFEENRAVVWLKSGLKGIINRKGDYIIEPIYSEIDFDLYTGITTARNDDGEFRFNYHGERIEK